MWWQIALLNLSAPLISQLNLGLGFIVEKHLVNLMVLGVIPGTNARIEYYHFILILIGGLFFWLYIKHKRSNQNAQLIQQSWLNSQSI